MPTSPGNKEIEDSGKWARCYTPEPPFPPYEPKPDEKWDGQVGDDAVETRFPIDNLIVDVGRDKPTPAGTAIAQKFVDLLKDGKSPNAAARSMGTTFKRLMSLTEVQGMVKDLVENYTLHADARRLLVRATANKILLETQNVAGAEKLALEAAKIISADPEVGLQQTVVGVAVDRSALSKLFAEPVTIEFAPEPPEKPEE